MTAAAIQVPIGRVEGLRTWRLDDLLAVEEPLEIRLGGRSLTITMRTPGNDFELAAGFLFAEGIIRSIEQVRSMGRSSDGSAHTVLVELADGKLLNIVQPQRNFLMTSACGVCGKVSLRDLDANACPILPRDEIQLSPDIFYHLPDRLRAEQRVFESTGGLHAAALFDLQGELQEMREDIGRHNAVDKLVGVMLACRRTPLHHAILLVSGRASFELVQKALMAGVPIMAAVGAPSSLAVATARRSGMTLIGFLKNGRFNVYTGRDRIFCLE
jgi:FdhD protein